MGGLVTSNGQAFELVGTMRRYIDSNFDVGCINTQNDDNGNEGCQMYNPSITVGFTLELSL